MSEIFFKYAVRRVGTPQEVRDIIIEKAKTEGWRPGSFDHVSYFAADNNGFFVGELDRELISCISAVKYSSNFGSYIVDKKYRGKGYGLQTWKVALASLSESCNMGGDAVVENLPLYRRFGLEPYWEEQRFQFVASEVSKALANFNVTDKTIEIIPPSQQVFYNLLKYDTEINVFSAAFFLEKLGVCSKLPLLHSN